MSKTLVWENIVEIANSINVEPCALKAIIQIESGGAGFNSSDKVKILFEGHIFYKYLKTFGLDADGLAAKYPNIVYKSWTKMFYGKTQVDEYKRFELAKSIHMEAALLSTSYGLMQVMGFNYKTAGYKSVQDFVFDMEKNEKLQVLASVNFMKANGLLSHIQNKNWAKFAYGYNGPKYADNKYDTKLAAAYANCKSSK